MLRRLLGLETEYAIRYTPAPGCDRPSNRILYDALVDAIGQIVPTRPGTMGQGRPRIFTANGGAFCYESLPYAPHGGLIEGGTPECRGPGQLLLYQRAQDALLSEACQRAEISLHRQGHHGTLGVLKNCRDAEGHVYGAQENYEAVFAEGASLWLYRIGLAALGPLIAALIVSLWTLTAALGVLIIALGMVGTLAAVLLLGLIPPLRRALSWVQARPWYRGLVEEPELRLGRAAMYFELAFMWPLTTSHALLMRAFAFRPVRRQIAGFLVSRPVLTGAGTLMEDDHFGLSEKGPAIRRLIRSSVHPDNRPLFDTGNLMKGIALPFLFQFRPYLDLFKRRQRLQLGLSDANLAQVAEYLKIGTTALMIDLAEAGALDGVPQPTQPIRALHAWISDPTLTATAPCRAGQGPIQALTALQVQRAYLDALIAHLDDSQTDHLEAREIARLWGEALDALADDPGALLGRLDWVSKRYLLETAGPGAGPAGRKKIDLRYHELGDGLYAELERADLCPTLVSEAELAHAKGNPPEDSPAKIRGRLIQALADRQLDVKIGWDVVRIGGPVGGKVVRLADYRLGDDPLP